ncbi:MAG: hypothetical protein OXR03_28240, partial [Rhodospirillaceae bacterium]|nr:hypothetical protein [Rhodospirillaceae bacterium]
MSLLAAVREVKSRRFKRHKRLGMISGYISEKKFFELKQVSAGYNCPVDMPGEEAQAMPVNFGNLRILVVDSDQELRNLTRDMLDTIGISQVYT